MATGERARRPASGRREQIIDVAAPMFHSRGFQGVSIEQIAADVGVSGPALYRHFRSKSDILAAVVERAIAAIDEAVVAADHLGVSRALARLAVSDAHVGTLLARERRHLDGTVLADVDARIERDLDAIAERLEIDDKRLARFAAGEAIAMAGSTSFFEPKGPAATEATICRAISAMVACVQSLGPDSLHPSAPDPAPRRGWLPKREAIIAATPAIWEAAGGFDRATLEDYAAAVGITGPSSYTYFSSKVELEGVVMERGSRWLLASLEQALAFSQSADDVMRRALSGYIQLVSFAPSLAGPLEPDDPRLNPDVNAALIRFAEQYLTLWGVCARSARPDSPDVELEVLLRAALAVVNEARGTGAVETVDDATLLQLALAAFCA